jgi:cell division protease FtsH
MVCEFGMSDEIGPQSFGEHEELLFLGREISRHKDYSEATAQRIDAEVNGLLRSSYAEAVEILRKNRDKLDLLAETLLDRETLDGKDVLDIIHHGRILSEAERGTPTPSAPQPTPAPEATPSAPHQAPPMVGTDAVKPSLA